jgi:hypothetical protein
MISIIYETILCRNLQDLSATYQQACHNQGRFVEGVERRNSSMAARQ